MVTTDTGTTLYDASEFLGSADGQAELLNDALRSGNPAYVAHALGIIAKAIGMSEIARRTGIKRQSLYAALDDQGNPTIGTFFSVLQALGIVLKAEAAAKEAAQEVGELAEA
jgi:probable addiction module antidote protein